MCAQTHLGNSIFMTYSDWKCQTRIRDDKDTVLSFNYFYDKYKAKKDPEIFDKTKLSDTRARDLLINFRVEGNYKALKGLKNQLDEACNSQTKSIPGTDSGLVL